MRKIETFSGRLINLKDPKPEDFDPLDVYIGLSRMPRFGGHTSRFYSVLEHSIYVYWESLERGYDLETQRKCFTHDFSEAYMMDIPSPLKVELSKFYEIESVVQNAIYDKWNVKGDYDLMKEIDWDICVEEGRYLMPSKASDSRWKPQNKPIKSKYVTTGIRLGWSEQELKNQFWSICGTLQIN